MSVFISWAGAESKTLALALRNFLRVVVQQSAPWVSDRDIAAGGVWDGEIEKQLKAARFGIACITPDSLKSNYLHYEVGAIANQVGEVNRVCPVLLGVEPPLSQPLGRFQAKAATRDGIWDLVQSVNAVLEVPIEETTLLEAFDGQWEKLKESIDGIKPNAKAPQPKTRSDLMLEEVLQQVRQIAAALSREERAQARDLRQWTLRSHAPATIRMADLVADGETPTESRLREEYRAVIEKIAAKFVTDAAQKDPDKPDKPQE